MQQQDSSLTQLGRDGVVPAGCCYKHDVLRMCCQMTRRLHNLAERMRSERRREGSR